MDEPRRKDFGSFPDDPRPGRGEEALESVFDELEVERRWIHRVRLDPEKFEYFYRKYRPRVFRYAFLNVFDHDLATDITSETFSLAADNMGRFRWQGRSFGAWLFRIARNVLLMEARRRKIRLETRYVPERHDRPDGRRPDRDLDESEDQALLMDAMARLGGVRREVLVNKYGLELTIREIAGVMDMPESTVKSHLQRGRAELLDMLTEMGLERPLSDRGRKAVRKAAAAEQGWDVVDEEKKRPE